MDALYAFARLADNLTDSVVALKEPAAAMLMAEQLRSWTAELPLPDTESLVDSKHVVGLQDLATQFDAIRPALHHAICRFDISPDSLCDLVAGVQCDLRPEFEINDFGDLSRYCYLVASSVGLACIQIWQGDLTNCESAAIDCGLAFQLTNILRDVAEDAQRGRIYLPQEDLQQFNCSRKLWLNKMPDGDWQGLMQKYIKLTRDLYERAWAVFEFLPPDGQRMFSLMWNSYKALLDRIEHSLPQIWEQRIGLSLPKKLSLYFSHAITPLYSNSASRVALR